MAVADNGPPTSASARQNLTKRGVVIVLSQLAPCTPARATSSHTHPMPDGGDGKKMRGASDVPSWQLARLQPVK